MTRLDMISGFLGAGKTTFAGLLLRNYMNRGVKPVYVVNEIGKAKLDADIMKADGFEAFEMEGGCICCTLKNDISVAIINIIDSFAPTNIVFEPSGVFIFKDFFDIFKDPEISKRCEMGSVLTIVDSVNFTLSKAAYGGFLYNQIKNAETIVLSKLEKIKNNPDEVICDIKNIHPNAFIMSKKWEDLTEDDIDLLMSRDSSARIKHRATHHNNLKSFNTIPDKSFSKEKLDEFISNCVSGAFGSLCRVKGVLKVEEQSVLLNIAMKDVTYANCKVIPNQSLTFIGQSVNGEAIAKFLQNC